MSLSPDLPDTQSSKPTFIRKNKRQINNTCGNSSLTKRLTRQLAGIMAHLQNHPRDTLSQQRVATINNLLRQ